MLDRRIPPPTGALWSAPVLLVLLAVGVAGAGAAPTAPPKIMSAYGSATIDGGNGVGEWSAAATIES